MALRIYLTGRVAVEDDEHLISERAFPGNQGRLAFVILVCERHRRIGRAELAEALWGDDRPEAWDIGLSAIVSKLRALFAKAGLPRTRVIEQFYSAYELQLPDDVWIDVEAAEHHLEIAEAHRLRGNVQDAYGEALSTYMIARRPLLAGEDGAWIAVKRRELQALLIRALDCLVDVYAETGKRALSIKFAEEALQIDPYNEAFYRKLMLLHMREGNRGAVVRAYEQCRSVLLDDLGIAPCTETDRCYTDAVGFGVPLK